MLTTGRSPTPGCQKTLSLKELEDQIAAIYFPNGRSEVQKLNISELNYFVANFAGDLLPEMESEGGFTVGKYFQKVKSMSMKLYLHTCLKEASLYKYLL